MQLTQIILCKINSAIFIIKITTGIMHKYVLCITRQTMLDYLDYYHMLSNITCCTCQLRKYM